MSNHTMLPATAGIPLRCNICHKKPHFSDVSHLLTHIASKGHLSSYYKMKVIAHTDPTTKRIVDQYDDWYEQWNLQDLMSERYDQKERKKSGNANSGNNSRRSSKVNAIPSSNESTIATNWAGRRAHQLRESTLDPQLGHPIKQEPKSRSGTPVSGFALDAAAFHRSYAPPMQGWAGAPYATTPIQHERSIIDSMYSTPTSDSGETDVPARLGRFDNRRATSGSNRSLALDEDDGEFDNGMNDSVKLKGIIWPGMDLFDSATPDMRRKRNQKKAFSVVQSLQATSEIVEATEQVFDADIVLKRERPITGNPEEDDGRSPLHGESTPEPEAPPPKKKAGRRPRPALTQKNVNSGRIIRNRHDSPRPPLGGARRAAAYLDDQDRDDELTYGGGRPRRRPRLGIHRDETDPEVSFSHPAPFEALTSGFRNPFQAALANAQAGIHTDPGQHGHRAQSSYPYGPRVVSSQNNPFGLPPPDFGSLSHLSGHSMFQNSGFFSNNPFPLSVGPRSGVTFPPSLNMNPQPFGIDHDIFQGSSWTGVQNQQPWDVFSSISQAESGAHAGADAIFALSGDDFGSASVNPLFIGSAHAAAEDDEATVSPPSEHS